MARAPLVLAALVGVLVLDGEFVYDDPSLLTENPVVTGEVPPFDAFVRDFWGRDATLGFTTWRPLMPLVWSQIWALFPEDPFPFRLLSVFLHVLAVGMAMRFVQKLTESPERAMTTGVLFAVHPLNTEAVSAIAAQADIASFALTLVACTVALGPQRWQRGVACALIFLFASLVKESAIIFTPLAGALLVLRPGSPKEKWQAIVPIGVVTAAVVAFQLWLPRAPGVNMITSNVAHSAEGGLRLLLGLYNAGRALMMCVWPDPISPNHGYAAVELHVASLAAWSAIGTLLLGAGVIAGIWAVRRRRLDWVAALCFLYGPAVLQTHWFVRLVTDLAERLLYPSVLGISMIFMLVLFRFVRRRTVRTALLGASTVAFLVVSLPARRAWTSEDALWTYAVEAEPRAALHHHNVSNTYFRTGDLDRGAYHRLIYFYLIERYPEPVQWEALAELDALPAARRFLELPATLDLEDPCRLVRSFAATARQYEPLDAYVRERWSRRYPQCGLNGVE